MKADFSKLFMNQHASRYNPNAQIRNKFAYVQGYSTHKIDVEIGKTTNAVYKANNVVSSRIDRIVYHYVKPVVNALFAGKIYCFKQS